MIAYSNDMGWPAAITEISVTLFIMIGLCVIFCGWPISRK